MSYLYIKSGGTATAGSGVYATKQASVFSGATSGYYSNISDAFVDATAGDTIAISYAESIASSQGNITSEPTADFTVFTKIICVDDTNSDEQVDGTAASGWHLHHTFFWSAGNFIFEGLRIKRTNYSKIEADTSKHIFQNCYVEHSSYIACDGFATSLELVNTDLNIISPSSPPLRPTKGGFIKVIGGSISCTTQTDLVGSNSQYTSTVYFNGVDCSGATVSYFLGDTGAVDTDDRVLITAINCKMPSLTAWSEESLVNQTHELSFVGCGVTDAACAYQFAYQNSAGLLEEDTSIYLTATEAVFGTTEVSAKVVTESDCSLEKPFRFKLPWVKYNDDPSASGSDNVRIKFAIGTGSLTKQEIWFDVVYPDGTNTGEYNTATSQPADLLGSTAHTTTTGEWTGSVAAQYYVDIDISDGSASAPELWVTCAKASASIYIDPVVAYV